MGVSQSLGLAADTSLQSIRIALTDDEQPAAGSAAVRVLRLLLRSTMWQKRFARTARLSGCFVSMFAAVRFLPRPDLSVGSLRGRLARFCCKVFVIVPELRPWQIAA